MWKLKCGQGNMNMTHRHGNPMSLWVCFFVLFPVPSFVHLQLSYIMLEAWKVTHRGGWQQLGTTRRRGSERSERVWSSLGRSVPSWPVEFIWIHTVRGRGDVRGGWGRKTHCYLLAFIWSAPEGKQELDSTPHPGPPWQHGVQRDWQDPLDI